MKNLIKKEMEALSKDERNHLILELMFEDKIDYITISNLYVNSLQKKERTLRLNILGLGNMLSVFVPFNKKKKNKKFIEGKSAYHILKSKIFRTAPIEKEYQEILKRTGYDEDEYGMPNKHIK